MRKFCMALGSAIFCLLLMASCNSSEEQVTVKGTVLSVSGNSLFIGMSEMESMDSDNAYVSITPSTVMKTSGGKSITSNDLKKGDSLIVVCKGAIMATKPPQITAASITLVEASNMEMVKAEYRKISPEQAQDMMKEDQNAIIADVRTQAEYEEQRIPRSILIPNEEMDVLAPELLADKDATILVYCRTGRRSKEVCLKLVNMGYTNVYDFGGIVDWPYQTISGK